MCLLPLSGVYSSPQSLPPVAEYREDPPSVRIPYTLSRRPYGQIPGIPRGTGIPLSTYILRGPKVPENTKILIGLTCGAT